MSGQFFLTNRLLLESDLDTLEIAVAETFGLDIRFPFEGNMDDATVMGIHRGKGDRFAPAADFLGGVQSLLTELDVLLGEFLVAALFLTGRL